MPVLYSAQTISTARIATRAWPTWTPVRLSFVTSTGQPAPGGHLVAAAAPVLTPTVNTMAAASSQIVPGAVRILVHSACRQSLMLSGPQPLPHAEREPASSSPGRRLQPRVRDHLVNPPRGQALGVGQPQQVVARRAAGLQR